MSLLRRFILWSNRTQDSFLGDILGGIALTIIAIILVIWAHIQVPL